MKRDSGDEHSMREVAYLHIHKKIASRSLRAGDPVSEVAIAKELGISRTPTREAIRQLVAEGILEESPGRGVIVVNLDVRDICELYEVREALEVYAVDKIARQLLGPVELNNLRQVAGEIRELAEGLQRSGAEFLDADEMMHFEAADIGFHTYLIQIAGNRRSLKMVKGLRALIRMVAMRRVGHRADDLLRIYQDHSDIVDAIEARDPARATAVLSAHIRTSQQLRLEQFVQREREAALPHDMRAFLHQIQAELG
ncbi:MAG: GntR family transcriptional regulator [Candidatus Solibacter sp.]